MHMWSNLSIVINNDQLNIGDTSTLSSNLQKTDQRKKKISFLSTYTYLIIIMQSYLNIGHHYSTHVHITCIL